MTSSTHRIIALTLLVIMAAPVIAQHDAQEHDHEAMHGSGELDLQRPDEGKWASDASLRQGMSEMRSAFDLHHDAYQEGNFDAEGAAELASTVEEKVNFMFANCQLPADADAELHKLLAAALGAARTLRQSDEPHQGLHQLHRVLQAYPEFFDHPDWTG